MKVFWKVVNTSSVHFSYSPWIWILSSSPAHILDQQWIYWTRSSSGWFVSRWSYSRPATPQSPPCGLSWHFEDLWTSGLNPRARSPTKFQQMMPDISPWMAFKKVSSYQLLPETPHNSLDSPAHISHWTPWCRKSRNKKKGRSSWVKKGVACSIWTTFLFLSTYTSHNVSPPHVVFFLRRVSQAAKYVHSPACIRFFQPFADVKKDICMFEHVV